MRDDAHAVQSYEPPSIEERTPIDVPLVANVSIPSTNSAAFRPASVESYEPPRIEARDPIDVPLIGNASPVGISAAFRTEQIADE